MSNGKQFLIMALIVFLTGFFGTWIGANAVKRVHDQTVESRASNY